MILVGLGGNLPGPAGPPPATLEAALERLAAAGVRTVRRSRWYRAAPVPPSGQPWYTNGVALVETGLDPAGLLALMLRVEASLGRRRRPGERRWAARVLDLDLLAYGDLVVGAGGGGGPPPVLPHPRLHERAFVLLPWAEVAPAWRHPVTGRTVAEMIRALPPGQQVEPLAGGS